MMVLLKSDSTYQKFKTGMDQWSPQYGSLPLTGTSAAHYKSRLQKHDTGWCFTLPKENHLESWNMFFLKLQNALEMSIRWASYFLEVSRKILLGKGSPN